MFMMMMMMMTTTMMIVSSVQSNLARGRIAILSLLVSANAFGDRQTMRNALDGSVKCDLLSMRRLVGYDQEDS